MEKSILVLLYLIFRVYIYLLRQGYSVLKISQILINIIFLLKINIEIYILNQTI